MFPYNDKFLKKNQKPIEIKIDIETVRNRILNLRNKIFKKQKELLEYNEFFKINDENDTDVLQINKEINILNEKLEKSTILYKQYKNN